MCVDLHTHSVYSDGSATPADLIELAAHNRLHGLALTDHDTVEGVAEFLRLGEQAGLTVLSGVEVSSSLRQHTLHILGYGIDHTAPELHEWLAPLQAGRARRNEVILDKLRALGVAISEEEVERISCCGQTGRPHIARLLMEKGVVDSFQAAFRLYLGRNKPAWEGRFSYTAAETIAMIHRFGGIAVLAHPGQIDPEMRLQPLIIRELAGRGLDGIEVYYPAHTRKMLKKLKTVAAANDLLVTGGSDYHGATRPLHPMAGGAQGICPPASLLDAVQARLNGRDR